MSHYYEEKWSSSGPIKDSQEQIDFPSTTQLSPPAMSSHIDMWSRNDSFDDQADLLMHSNSYVSINIKEEEKSKLFQHAKILDDLIDDAILEVCFECHRVAKLCPNGMNKFYDTKPKNLSCYLCGLPKGPTQFSKHLFDCFSKLDGNTVDRKAKAKANNNFKENEVEDEDFDDFDDDERRERDKKYRGKCKSQGNSLLKPSYNNSPKYEHMSFDEKKKFFGQKCGVVTKRSKRPCMNTLKCTVHSQDERDNVRDNHLKNDDENDCVDVDSIDVESIILPPFGVGDESTSLLSNYFCSPAFP